jgi:AbrB family looped-hinge helix DNA binding protein
VIRLGVAKITSKLQVTIPKALAEKYGLEPGDDIEWSATGSTIRIARKRPSAPIDVCSRLELFDAATSRQRERERTGPHRPRDDSDRGWTREELYERAKPR